MKKVVLVLLIIPLLLSCEKEEKQIKSFVQTVYSAKKISNEFVKDTIKHKFSIGNYPDGSQEYSVGLIGYGESDTTKFEKGELSIKKIDNKEFIYRADELQVVYEYIKDTVYMYQGEFLDDPYCYYIFEKNKKYYIEEFNYLFNIRKKYKNIKINEYGDEIYHVSISDYIPSDLDKKYYSKNEIDKKRVEKHEIEIIEIEYVYYE